MSVRLRLTLFYTAVLALTLALLGGVVYAVQARSTLADVEETLQRRSARLVAGRQYMLGGEGPAIPPDRPEVPTSTLAPPDTYLQWRTLDGELVDPPLESASDVILPLSDGALEALRSGHPWTEIATVEGERTLIYNEPVVLEGEPVEILQMGTSLTGWDTYLGALRRNLLTLSAAATVLAFGAGWVLAGLALRPIHRITRTAQAIGAERDLSRRVEHSGPDDEIGQLATTLNAMLGELQAAYQQQQQFVAEVSHELRTPLTTIRGNLELLRLDPPIGTDERADVLDDVVGESERLIRLVNDLLTLARAESGRLLRSEPVSIKPIVEDVCRQARLLDPDRVIICDDLLDVAVLGDEDALRQVLLILLDNALKHSTGPVTIATTLADGKVPNVAIGIRDAGPGIDPTAMGHIFERFYRSEAARDTPGVGLGLPIARALIEAQGGSIAMKSQAGPGSVFTIALPMDTTSRER